MPLFRRRPVPDAVRSAAVPAGDRRLAWAVTAGGEAVVATRRGLLLPGRPLLAWTDVERASWTEPHLTVVEVSEVEGTGTTTVVEVREPGDLPEVVRSMVTASVAWSAHARLQPQGGVRVVGRRRPGEDLLEWQLVYDRGTDLSDPLVREQAQQVLLDARRTIG